jgi:hypothetical protein
VTTGWAQDRSRPPTLSLNDIKKRIAKSTTATAQARNMMKSGCEPIGGLQKEQSAGSNRRSSGPPTCGDRQFSYILPPSAYTGPGQGLWQTMRSLALVLPVLIGSGTAACAEWRYCFRLDEGQRRFYISQAASIQHSLNGLAMAFSRAISVQSGALLSVSCPRADDKTGISALMEHAIRYNRENGNTVVRVNWSPETMTASP